MVAAAILYMLSGEPWLSAAWFFSALCLAGAAVFNVLSLRYARD
jgi:hypothetical protein